MRKQQSRCKIDLSDHSKPYPEKHQHLSIFSADSQQMIACNFALKSYNAKINLLKLPVAMLSCSMKRKFINKANK